MRSAQAAREEPAGENDAGNDHPPEREPQEQKADRRSARPPDAPKPRPVRAGRAKPAPATDPTLVVVIDPTWGDRKVFRHYRASLAAFRPNGSATPPEIARFRAANSAIETRLQVKLPQLMREIDALYDGGPEWAPRRCRPCDPKTRM